MAQKGGRPELHSDGESTQTIVLSDLFTSELTTTGSFDIRSGIWKTTFGKVIQALPIPTLLIDPSFRIVVANQAWRRISVRYEEIQGRLFSTLFPGASAAKRAHSILENVFATRKPVAAQSTLEIENRTIYARMTFRSVRITEERLVLVLVEDLTPEKQLAQQNKKHLEELERRVEERTSELIAANARLKEEVDERKRAESERDRFFNLSVDMLCIAGFDGFFKQLNPAWTKTLGWTNEELLSKPWIEFVHREDRPRAIAARDQLFSGNAMYNFETRYLCKDGTHRWISWNSFSLPEEELIFCVARDVTAHKKADEQLRQSEEKYRFVVDNAHEAIVVAQDGMLKFVNPRAVELVGFSEEEFTSRPFLEFVYPDDRPLVMERYEKRISGEPAPNAYDFRIIDKFGNIKWVEVNAILVSWHGKPATLNFFVDITHRRRMEDELAKVEKLESLGVLAGGIAHDFNNILTAILGNISLAKMHCHTPEKAAKTLVEAERACLQAQGLTQQLLTFSKGGAPVKETVEIGQLIEASCHFAARGSNVRCEISITKKLGVVEVDKGQIGQVIHNLVLNAVHAMPKGGVVQIVAENVTVTPQEAPPFASGNYVRIMVRDHGVGIPKDILPRIFDPYFSTKHKGSGLGLATSFSIIKNHEGFIKVESSQGIGTTFHVYLPASPKQLEMSSELDESVVDSGGKILVMDDEDAVRGVAGEILSTLGYDVELVRDGAEAIRLYEMARESSRPFDAVLLDLTVPGGMGGAEALERLREIDPGIKAIVSSGYSHDPIMADYTKYGFKAVVAKPYSVQDLRSVLRRVMTNA